MAAAAGHVGVAVGIAARVVAAAIGVVIIGIIGRLRIGDAGASLDRAVIAALIAAAVGRFIGAVPTARPAPLGIIGAAEDRVGRRRGRVAAAAIIDLARHPEIGRAHA